MNPLSLCLVGPGIMPIPPPGWGAVEILLWDYYTELKRQGVNVTLINKIRRNSYEQSNLNTPYCRELITEINSGNYDFVHIHYDCLYHIIPYLTAKHIGITSHYPYIDQQHKHIGDGYSNAFAFICNNKNHHIFALSQKDFNAFKNAGALTEHLHLILNGSNEHEIIPIENKTKPYQSIYIAKIEDRKQQKKYCTIPNIDFFGRCEDTSFQQLQCYKGEVDRDTLIKELCNHGNLILLSTGENGTPLVIKEALMAGLPIVTNKHSINDLDISLPFIDVIPDDKLHDTEYIARIIQENLKKQYMKNEIRHYAVTNFTWKSILSKYVSVISTMISTT